MEQNWKTETETEMKVCTGRCREADGRLRGKRRGQDAQGRAWEGGG